MASVIAAVRRALRHGARIRYRLLLVNVIVAIVPIAGIVFAEMHEAQLLHSLERDMIHQAQLVRAIVMAEPAVPLAKREHMLNVAARDTRTRIRLLDTQGNVAADSHRGGPPEGAERPVPRLIGESPRRAPSVPEQLEVKQRREVQAAIAGRYGAATRLWENQDRVYLFSALPIKYGENVSGIVYVTRSTHDVKLELYKLRRFLTQILLATLAITALLTLVLATTIARPLGKLTRRAQRIAARQAVDGDSLGERSDEIGQLARAVDAMTEELERRAKDSRTLAADISHELKNPLAGIRGAAELLRDGIDDAEARERFLEMIIADTARLDRIVSRLFELARVEDDRSAALPVDVADLAHACAARPWPVPVTVMIDGAPIASGRSAQLAAAIENLVANATQFADPETSVRVVLEERRESVRVTVMNHGPALSATAQRKVWDRFYSTRVESGGSGLGLSIVRSVALAHGGTVGVSCEDGVTSFWFEIRAAR
ncbi:MAG: ATP-binding protein [Myxococcota bacterium]|nr:ATP-binding protein [Myxococcota bacterium]